MFSEALKRVCLTTAFSAGEFAQNLSEFQLYIPFEPAILPEVLSPMEVLSVFKDGCKEIYLREHEQEMILQVSTSFNRGNVKVVIQETYFFNNSKTTQLKNGCAVCLVTQLCLTLCDPMDCSPPGSSAHGDSPGKNTGACCHALLQGIFLTQGWNPGLPHCRQILSRLSHHKTEIHICSKETKGWPIGT